MMKLVTCFLKKQQFWEKSALNTNFRIFSQIPLTLWAENVCLTSNNSHFTLKIMYKIQSLWTSKQRLLTGRAGPTGSPMLRRTGSAQSWHMESLLYEPDTLCVFTLVFITWLVPINSQPLRLYHPKPLVSPNSVTLNLDHNYVISTPFATISLSSCF